MFLSTSTKEYFWKCLNVYFSYLEGAAYAGQEEMPIAILDIYWIGLYSVY